MKSMIVYGLCHLFLSLILLRMPFPCLLWSTHGWMQGKFFCILCDLYLSLHSPNTTCHSAQVLVGTAILNWAGREKSTHATDKTCKFLPSCGSELAAQISAWDRPWWISQPLSRQQGRDGSIFSHPSKGLTTPLKKKDKTFQSTTQLVETPTRVQQGASMGPTLAAAVSLISCCVTIGFRLESWEKIYHRVFATENCEFQSYPGTAVVVDLGKEMAAS